MIKTQKWINWNDPDVIEISGVKYLVRRRRTYILHGDDTVTVIKTSREIYSAFCSWFVLPYEKTAEEVRKAIVNSYVYDKRSREAEK